MKRCYETTSNRLPEPARKQNGRHFSFCPQADSFARLRAAYVDKRGLIRKNRVLIVV